METTTGLQAPPLDLLLRFSEHPELEQEYHAARTRQLCRSDMFRHLIGACSLIAVVTALCGSQLSCAKVLSVLGGFCVVQLSCWLTLPKSWYALLRPWLVLLTQGGVHAAGLWIPGCAAGGKAGLRPGLWSFIRCALHS